MKPKISLLHLKNIPILHQLQLEEALLRADQGNWCVINEGSSPAIVMGISGNLDLLVNKAKMQQQPIPVIRRFSGGGTVVVSEHTYFVTFICNRKDLPVASYPEHVLRWTEQFYKPIFPSNFKLQENDYVFDNRKFGGNAQYFCKDRWLHHSSLLWDFEEAHMDYLLMPPKMPSYRQKRTHSDFLCKLRESHPDKQQLSEKIRGELNKLFNVNRVEKDQVKHISILPHRKATALIM
ncbi:MAG: lipoate--protein ligase family protein [Parachlamydiaceae bacterium]|nr:lipoate--protein ligase family protein [Parachlamydiaceae bacterium]